MTRTMMAVLLAAVLFALAGCSTAKPGVSTSETTVTASKETTFAPGNSDRPYKMVGKDKIFLHVVKTYDPAKYPKAAMDGEPSQIHFFKPEKDEGIRNRDYPDYGPKTFKFLALPSTIIPPQDYYMLQKNGGTLNKALKGTGYKATEILDGGHIKILPNLYLGYYDFAWVSLNVMTEYWSGNESMNAELWRGGNDYVIIGASYNGGISLIAPPTVTDIKQLDGGGVGIMNPSFNMEALLNKKLKSVGLATESDGGTVGIEMAPPGYVMNDLMASRLKAVMAWGSYEVQLRQRFHYRELISWDQMGYGKKVPYNVLVVRRDILAKHPDIVQKVVQLNYEGTQEALKVGDFREPEYKRVDHFKSYYMGTPSKKAANINPKLLNLDAEANPVFLRDVYDYMVEHGYFKEPYEFEELVDHSFYEKIAK